MKHALLVALEIIVLVYVGLGILLYLCQNRLLYHPKTYSQAIAIQTANDLGVRLWPDPTSSLGFISHHAPQNPIGTLLVFHGNAGSAIHRTHYISTLEPLGFRVILCEYPGYGHSPGKPGQASFVAAAHQAIQTAHQLYPEPLFVLGESLGSGVAAAAVKANRERIKGVLLVTPWDTLPDLGQTLYWYFPTKWLTRDRYDSILNLAEYTGPIGIVMAGQDEVIPNKHTQRLYDTLNGNKHLFRLDRASHNNWMERVDSAWWQDIKAFLFSDSTK